MPPATDTPTGTDITDTDQYREQEAEVKREIKSGELDPDADVPPQDRPDYPPTRYEER